MVVEIFLVVFVNKIMKKKKTLQGYYIDGKGNIFELWQDENGRITQQKMK